MISAGRLNKELADDLRMSFFAKSESDLAKGAKGSGKVPKFSMVRVFYY